MTSSHASLLPLPDDGVDYRGVEAVATTRWDVLIVGAGPAGSTLATILARRGHRILLVDRAVFPRFKVCGHYLNPAGLAALERCGIALDLDGHPHSFVRGAIMALPNGRRMVAQFSAGTSLGIMRTDLDHLLLQAAQAQPTVRVMTGCTVRNAVVRDGQAVGVQVTCGGTERRLSARWIVAADGIHSVIARRVGRLRRRARHRKVGLLAGIEQLRAPADLLNIYPLDFRARHDPQLPSRPCYLGLTPIGTRHHCGLVIDEEDFRRHKGNLPALFARVVNSHRGLTEVFARARLPQQFEIMGPLAHVAGRPRVANVLTVGDAGGFYDPLMGDGLAHAIESAVMAGMVLHRALAGGRSARAAAREYARARRRREQGGLLMAQMMQYLIRHPALLDWSLGRLTHRPALRLQLADAMAGIGNPWAVLSPAFAAGMLVPASWEGPWAGLAGRLTRRTGLR